VNEKMLISGSRLMGFPREVNGRISEKMNSSYSQSYPAEFPGVYVTSFTPEIKIFFDFDLTFLLEYFLIIHSDIVRNHKLPIVAEN
jgi:hypothetical protein